MSRGSSYLRCVEEAIRVLSGRWVAPVLAALATRPLHFSDLLTEVNAAEQAAGQNAGRRRLTGKVLVETLRRMEHDGLVRRHRQDVAFPQVWYELTPTARSLLKSLRPIVEWAKAHQEKMAGSGGQDKTES